MLCARTLPRDNPFITPDTVLPISPPKEKLNRYQKKPAYLLKLSGWPCGPLRTVMPEVPVEPALLGAGLVWLSDSWSVWNSVVLIATVSPSRNVDLVKSENWGDALGGEGKAI